MSEPDASTWKRRERAMLYGLLTWALGVSVLATLRPEWTAEWIVTHRPLEVAGVILVSVGMLGGIFDYGQQIVNDWVTADTENLTEIPEE